MQDWEYLCSECTGYSCDGDSEEFTASYSATLVVPVVWVKGNLSVGRTANRVIDRAKKAIAEFEQNMARISKGLEC